VKTLNKSINSLFRELPQETFARWASVILSLSILAILFSIAIAQAFLALAGLTYLLGWIRRRRPMAFPPIGWPILLFSLLTVLSVLGAPNQAVGWFAVRKLVLFLIIVLALNLIVSLKHLELLYTGLFAGSAIAGLLGTAQFIAEYHTLRVHHPGFVYLFMENARPTGFQGDWMNFGGQQMLVWVMLAAFLLLRRRVARFWWLVAAVISVSIILNFTRGVWVGCFVAGLYVVARWKARLLWIVPAAAVLVALFSPRLVQRRLESVLHPTKDPSIAMRFEMWGAGWRMIKRHPWLGVGPNNINQVYDLYLVPGEQPALGYHGHLHSDYIQFAAERGLPCLAAWLWLMGVLGWEALKIRRSTARGRWMADGAFAAWLAFMIEGFFEFNFGTSPVLMLYLFVATTPFIVERLQRSGVIGPHAEGGTLSSSG
jgi:putative inorganic carbon (hco3(-)) transporter